MDKHEQCNQERKSKHIEHQQFANVHAQLEAVVAMQGLGAHSGDDGNQVEQKRDADDGAEFGDVARPGAGRQGVVNFIDLGRAFFPHQCAGKIGQDGNDKQVKRAANHVHHRYT